MTTCASLLPWQKLETICPSLDGPKTYLKNQTLGWVQFKSFAVDPFYVFKRICSLYTYIWLYIKYYIKNNENAGETTSEVIMELISLLKVIFLIILRRPTVRKWQQCIYLNYFRKW